MAARLIPSGDGFEAIATILLLVCVGTSSGGGVPLGPATAALNELGWRHSDRRLLQDHELYWLPAVDVLKNVADEPADRINRRRVSPAAATLARAALRQ